MMKFKVLAILFLVTGCAHKTIHEYCTEPDVAERYRDYTQCYAETQASGGPPRAGKVIGAMFSGFSEGNRQPASTRCTTNVIGNSAYTDCQ